MAYQRKTIDIIISDDLRRLLSNIKNQSVVAEKLLKGRVLKEDLVDNPINYISISTSDRSKISYLTTDRMSTLSVDEYWSSSRRFQVKPGSFITKVLKNIHPKDVELFATLFKSETTKYSYTWEVVTGDKIKEYYSWESYATNSSGSLGVSCMKHDSCQRLLNIYTSNTDQVSMLTMLNSEGLLMGRAVLWNVDGEKIMDRIYTINDEELQHQFKKWATENGYLYKSEQNWSSTLFFENLKKEKTEIKLKFELSNKEFRYYPYMDTLKFIDINGIIYNYQPKDVDFYTLASCDGGKYDDDYLKLDDIDKVYRHRGECVWLQYLDINTKESNTRWSRANNCYILKKDSVYNGHADDYIFNEDYNSNNNWVEINNRIDIQNRRNNVDSDTMRYANLVVNQHIFENSSLVQDNVQMVEITF